MEKDAPKSLKERKPGQHTKNPTSLDGDGNEVRTRVVKNAWKRASTGQSLKEYARKLAAGGDEDAKRWLHNKRVNTKKPQLGLGRTSKTKGGKR